MNKLLEVLLSPYKAHKKSVARERELRKRDLLNTEALEESQRVLITERDLDEILQKYIDSGDAKSVKVKFPREYLEYAKSYLDKQQIEYIVLDDEHILIEG